MANSDIVPQGPAEVIAGPATIARPVLQLTALTDLPVTAIVPLFPATPANGAAVSATTVPARSKLTNLKSISITSGTAEVIYRY